ncbi:MAG: flagellar hook-basal body complex protein FliE [Lysobacterales bacterium]
MTPVNNQAISSVLAQMRQVAQSGAIPTPPATTPATEVAKSDFAQMVSSALEGVSNTQAAAGKAATAFEQGDPEATLPQVMIALEKASVSFEGVKQVRNRLVTAYQEIMNMPV